MRILVPLLLLTTVARAAPAPAPAPRSDMSPVGTPTPAPPSRTSDPPTPASRPEEQRPPRLGLLLDGGFPDGLALSALYRPIRMVRVDAGVTYNLIGFGLRGGATLVPFQLAVSPTLRAEYGHTFDGDASGLVGHFSDLTQTERTLLKSVSYDYASVQLGLEMGAPDRFLFFVRGGVAWFWATVQNFQAAVQAANPSTPIEAQDPKIHGRVPTASVGLLLFFW